MGFLDQFLRREDEFPQPTAFDFTLPGAEGPSPQGAIPLPQPQAMAPPTAMPLPQPQGVQPNAIPLPNAAPPPDVDMAEMGNPYGMGAAAPAPKKPGFLQRLGNAVQSDAWSDFAATLQDMGGNTEALANRRAQSVLDDQRRVRREAEARMKKQAQAARAASQGGGWNQAAFDEVMGDGDYDPQDVAAMKGLHTPNEQLITDADGNQFMLDKQTLKKRPVVRGRPKPVRVVTADGRVGYMMPPEINQGDDDGMEPAPATPRPPAPAPIPAEAPVPAAAKMSVSPTGYTPADRQGLIDMIATEARGEGDEGMAAAGHVAMNRLRRGHGGAKTLRGVVDAPSQFEGMKNAPFLSAAQKANAARIADGILSGQIADPTNGAVNFINPVLQAKLGRKQPKWAPAGQGQQIGNHVFYGGKPQMAAAGGQNNMAGDPGDDELDPDVPVDDEEETEGWGDFGDETPEGDEMGSVAGQEALQGGPEDDALLPPGYTWLVPPSGGPKKGATYHPSTAEELKGVKLDPNSAGFQTSSTGQVGRIPGLPKAESGDKAKAREAQTQRGVVQANAMIGNTNEILKSITHGISWGGPKGKYIPFTSPQAGMLGAVLSKLPETEAKAIAGKIDTLKANLAWEKLQAMRDASPTGGALGQVSEMELRLLASSVSSLDQSLSPDDLKANLVKVRNHFDNWLSIQREAGVNVDAIMKGSKPEGGAVSTAAKPAAKAAAKPGSYEVGKVYTTPKGKLRRTASGWEDP